MDKNNIQGGNAAGKLRKGYTTGTCAAAATQGALQAALAAHMGKALPRLESVAIRTPAGIVLEVPIEELAFQQGLYCCSVKKDSGDDPDVTNGILVYSRVRLLPGEPGEITIEGGEGVGRVTKPGLACQVGQPAINPVPRKMIEEQVRLLVEDFSYEGGVVVEISAPEGVRLAKKTFNPRLGIEGGISILGTSGIVEPMSEQALIDTIKVEMNVCRAAGAEYLVVTPGNYGETFLKQEMNLLQIHSVKCSNFMGDALDYAREQGFKGLLLVGHIGKLVKLAIGVMNTHSKYGDGRMEILTAHAAAAGADSILCRNLMKCVTTDDAIRLLDERGLREKTLESLLEQIRFYLRQRAGEEMETAALMFSNRYGYLGQTKEAGDILRKL